jgi:hypothetical protein
MRGIKGTVPQIFVLQLYGPYLFDIRTGEKFHFLDFLGRGGCHIAGECVSSLELSPLFESLQGGRGRNRTGAGHFVTVWQACKTA